MALTLRNERPSLVGSKAADTDSAGYYRFVNLPPGTYTISVAAKGFKTIKREGLTLEVGHQPTVDIALEIGTAAEVVEVTGAAPIIDVTTETTQTNVTQDVVQDVPHGRSFQSVIQFAPSARNEPLMGSNRASNGTGGSSPGNGSNGSAYGFSVAGGSDSENSYLVEGQETANIIGGYSHTNVPFDFIQEVQVKSSGIEAEHGGALGGVVNVDHEEGPEQLPRLGFRSVREPGVGRHTRRRISATIQLELGTHDMGSSIRLTRKCQPVKPHTSDVFPGFTFGGPIMKDKIFFFVGFNPEWNDFERKVELRSGQRRRMTSVQPEHANLLHDAPAWT